MRGAPITVFEITTAAGLLLFARNPADVLSAGGRPWRAARRNQCHRQAAGHDHHARFRSITSIFSATRWRKLPPRRPAFSSAACRRSLPRKHRDALAVIERQAAQLGAPLKIAGEDWTATEERGRLVYQDEDGLLDLPRAETLRPPSIRECRTGHRGVAHDQAIQDPAGGVRSRHDQGRLAGAAAAARHMAGWSISRRRAASSGSTAGIIPMAAAPLRPRLPISRSACRGRWC